MKSTPLLTSCYWTSFTVSMIGWAFFGSRGLVHVVGFTGSTACVIWWLVLNRNLIWKRYPLTANDSETKGPQ